MDLAWIGYFVREPSFLDRVDSRFSVVERGAPANLAKYLRESENESRKSEMG